MIKLFRITSAALLTVMLALSYQGISQQPGGNVIKTEREGLLRNCSEAKGETFSWKDITLIVFGTGIIVTVIIITFLCCCIKRYKERGFHQGHSGKSKQERDQLLQTPDAVVSENEVLRNKLGELQNEIGKLQDESEKLHHGYGKLQDEHGKLKDENEKLHHEYGKLQDENGKLQDEHGKLKDENGKLQNEIDKRKAQYKHAWKNVPLYPDWRKEEFKPVNMTLDAATAHPALLLSEEGRQVSWQERCQEIPSSSERFISIPCVLGQLRIISGRYSWDVEVGDACSWDLGVCRDNVTRNGRVTMSPKNGFWAIRFYDGEYWALTSPETHLTLREKPFIVRVFLDYEAGDVSFYNMTDGSHIFTFSQDTFFGVLRPLFRLWSSESGSLTICAGEECADVVIHMSTPLHEK